MAKILIIEPDKILAGVYAQSLTMAGFKVEICLNAQLAVNLIDKQLPDLIILEPQLPEHGGVEFIYELRSYAEWQRIPIVVHSLVPKNVFSNNNLQIQELGVTHYLYKPVTTLFTLNRTIKEALVLANNDAQTAVI